jgi:pimeloyl-ACP methyl ester carboxylesterase
VFKKTPIAYYFTDFFKSSLFYYKIMGKQKSYQTHAELKSTYWYQYVRISDPKEIEKSISEEFVELGGNKVHLDIYEPPKSIDCIGNVIFIHGTSIYSRFYADFCYGLMLNGYRVLAPDMPGHGLSDGYPGHFTMNSVLNTIKSLLSIIGERYSGKIAIMGSSLGGISSLYAISGDERISTAVCHNAAIFNEEAYKQIVHVKGFFKLLMPFVPTFAKLFPKLRLDVFNYLPAESLVNTPEGYEFFKIFSTDPLLQRKYTLTALRTQMEDALPVPVEQITKPIMLINGDQDGLFSIEYMQSIFNRLSNKDKEFVIIKNAAHLIIQEHTKEVLDSVVPFLNKHLK